MELRYIFSVSGPSGRERAEALLRASELWQQSPRDCADLCGNEPPVYIIVTNPTEPDSVERAVHYAADELRAGIVEAGGSLGDETHVWITRTLPKRYRR
jgi:hypothetical protein